MLKPLEYLIDFIFPPSDAELVIRALLPTDLISKTTRSPNPPFSFIKSLFAYKDPIVSELIWQIKYKKNRHAISCAGYALYENFKKQSENKEKNIILIPIPISKKRRRERGYNQCELLVDEIMKLDIEKRFVKSFDLLFRTKHIERQTLKGRIERLENTKDIFKVIKSENFLNKGQVKIVIIDDVVTTGSTLVEARNTLLNAGFVNVECLTIAH